MKQHSPACERNRAPILEQLQALLPPSGLVLEIASGSGQHAVHFAAGLPGLHWQPTDADPVALASVAAWRAEAALPNLLPPLALSVLEPWPIAQADAIFCANMVHISPWECTLALLAGAAQVLPPGGRLVLYGPYRRDGQMVASNVAFDESLRRRDPRWGVRDLEALLAAATGFSLERIVEMPANNLIVSLSRDAG